MTVRHSLADSVKALLLFVTVGPLIGTLGWIAFSIWGVSHVDIRAVRFFAVVGVLFALIPAAIAGLTFVVIVRLPLFSRSRRIFLVAVPLLAALDGALSSWFFFGLLEFATKIERSLTVAGAASGAVCSLIWLWLVLPSVYASGEAGLAQTTISRSPFTPSQ